ncbi:MAG: TRAP transporter substrate-binding protein [Fusobacterium gastrosuis]|uniref:TRAP transporter substrate-binding protein n=1 Tax=Fusobacterium gastrosuis TaxID=1755100 RepID=UPI002A877691|nr:TRAP transporter substrate-binding protein [Fusobacterium gastrosuis]
MKKFKLGLAMLLSMLFLIGCGGKKDGGDTSAKTYEVYLGCDNAEDSVTYLLLDKFATLMEEKSDGRIVAKRFSNAKLGGDVELIEGAQNGQVTFVVQNTAPQVNFIPEVGIFDLPMVFPNIEVARKVLDGPLLDKLKEYYAKQNIKLFGYGDQGFRQMTSNRRVDSYADLKGQKIRTMSNPNHIEFWKAVGANPTPMAFSELYIGLQQGVVDAQENPLETTIATKLYEQQKYVIMTNHVIHAVALIGSPKAIEQMPKDLQVIIDEAAAEALAWSRKIADERVDGRVKIIADSGTEIVPFNETLYNEMKNAGKPIYKLVADKIGADLVELIQSEVEKVSK